MQHGIPKIQEKLTKLGGRGTTENDGGILHIEYHTIRSGFEKVERKRKWLILGEVLYTRLLKREDSAYLNLSVWIV